MSLLDSVKGVMTNAVVDKAADVLGIESGMAKSAMKLFLPAIIGGVINRGNTPSGAGDLIDLFKKGGFGDGNLNDLTGVLGNPDKTRGFLETGSDILGTIFGNNKSGLLDMLLKTTGLSKNNGSSLLSFLAPIVINKLAGIFFGKNMNASGLASYLDDQKDEVMGLVPGLSGLLGTTSSTARESAAAATGAAYAKDSDNSGGAGWLKWLLPIVLLAGLAYWLMSQDGCGAKTTVDADADQTEMQDEKVATPKSTTSTSTNRDAESTSTTSTTTADVGSYTLADNGDILNASGSVAHTALSYDMDEYGNLVGTDGRKIADVADLSAAFKTKLESMIDGLRLNRMKMMFTDMIGKKAGASTSYALSNIEFKPENHLISNFSKAEVEGLAAALKANATGKIEVHVYTADGKDAKDNLKRSDLRANVIRDMLVTLGVNKDQIKAVGKGDTDAAKANMGKVDIVVG